MGFVYYKVKDYLLDYAIHYLCIVVIALIMGLTYFEITFRTWICRVSFYNMTFIVFYVIFIWVTFDEEHGKNYVNSCFAIEHVISFIFIVVFFLTFVSLTHLCTDFYVIFSVFSISNSNFRIFVFVIQSNN